MATADLNNDGFLNIIFSASKDPRVVGFLGYGNGSFTEQAINSAINYTFCSIDVADSNHDTRLDIVRIDCDCKNFHVLLAEGNVTFSNSMLYPSSTLVASLALGDFNNDSHLDIVAVSGYIDSNVGVHLGYGNGYFAHPIAYTTDYTGMSPHLANLNDDSRLDIVTMAYMDAKILIAFGCDNGSFVNQRAYSTGIHPESVAVADFSGVSERLQSITRRIRLVLILSQSQCRLLILIMTIS